MNYIQKTEQIIIRETDSRFAALDNATFLGKNLYNASMYKERQYFFKNNSYLSWGTLNNRMVEEHNPDYYALNTKVSQWVTKMVHLMWKAYDVASKDYEEHPEKYTGKPRIPGYLEKDGRYVLHFTNQAISKKHYDEHKRIKLSGIDVDFETTVSYEAIKIIRIVNRGSHIIIEIIYDVECPDYIEPNGIYASMDPGMRNLATITFSIPDIQPIVIDGSDVLSINNTYNKLISDCDSLLSKRTYKKEIEEFNKEVEENKKKKAAGEKTKKVNYKGKKKTKKKRKITNNRNQRIKSCMHKYSRYVVNLLVSHSVSIFFIGKNKGWKQDITLGDKTNQNFVQIPYAQFIEMLKYKCKEVWIKVVCLNESYTSKCSFLDLEKISKHKESGYKGQRIQRGLFKSSENILINADVNGSYNIMRRGLKKLEMNVDEIFNKDTVKLFKRHPKRVRIELG